MAGSFSDYLELELLDHILAVGAYTAPTIFVALYTAAPSDAGGGTEVSASGYARVATPSFGAAAAGAAANNAAITFATAGASWGTVTHFGIFDATSVGNLLLWADLTASKAVATGDVARFATGELDVTLG